MTFLDEYGFKVGDRVRVTSPGFRDPGPDGKPRLGTIIPPRNLKRLAIQWDNGVKQDFLPAEVEHADARIATYTQKVTVTFIVAYTGPEATFNVTSIDDLADASISAVRERLPESLAGAIEEIKTPRFADSRRFYFPGEDVVFPTGVDPIIAPLPTKEA